MLKKASFITFFLSISLSLFALLAERMIGIGWDYHVDSVTYATSSTLISKSILESEDLFSIVGRSYYLIVSMLNQSVIAVVSINIFLFSITNILIVKMHSRYFTIYSYSSVLMLMLLILNPYRIHLSTTMLKESLIIFLLTAAIFFRKKISLFLLFTLLGTLIRSIFPVYAFMAIKGNRYYYLILIIVLAYNFDQFLWVFDYSTTVNLVTRSFDIIPTFQEYGVYGNLLRSAVWPFITITGLFALISPDILFFLVSIGIVFSLIYVSLLQKKVKFDLNIILILGAVALIVPGYTTYIRYVFPVLVVWPLLKLSLKTK
jgi:hypothetical protein